MAYNHGKAEYKWKLWKEREEKILRDSGVTEDTIEAIRFYDRQAFNSDRRYYERVQETEADKAKTRAPEKRAVRTPLKVCMLAFTVLTVFGNAWTTRAEIRTAPYRKAYLQVSRELGLNYRTASDEDLETYLHNDPDAVRDAMRILEENHLNIFR